MESVSETRNRKRCVSTAGIVLTSPRDRAGVGDFLPKASQRSFAAFKVEVSAEAVFRTRPPKGELVESGSLSVSWF